MLLVFWQRLLPFSTWLTVLVATAVVCHAEVSKPGLPPGISADRESRSSDGPVGLKALSGREQIKAEAPETRLAADIIETRLFLTNDPGVVRGEIATAGTSGITELSVAVETGTVVFRDDGVGADRVKGDGVLSASFKYDSRAELDAIRPDLKATIDVLRAPDGNVLIRRGPRDIVHAPDALETADRRLLEPFDQARHNLDRFAPLLSITDPLLAAQTLGVNIDATPFLRLPGRRFTKTERQSLKLTYLFDFPILTVFPPPSLMTIDDTRSLMVTAKEVVEDPTSTFDSCSGIGSPTGVWSFGHLMRELAYGSGMTAEQFALQWLSSWTVPHTPNGVTVPPRDQEFSELIVNNWLRLSGSGGLNVDYFPARLLAIVNRPDLADHVSFGSLGSAGEARLVFDLIYREPHSQLCTPLGFTMAFEYGIPSSSCTAAKSWQQRWKDLDQLALGGDQYNQALRSITGAFTEHGSYPDQHPNLSSLSQLRTNEQEFGQGWQLREFNLQSTGLLDLATVKQTPDSGLEGSTIVHDYLRDNQVDIVNDRYVVPLHYPGSDPFLAGAAGTGLSTFFWSAPNLNTITNPFETRREFSLGTCSGCHTGETNTLFTHIGDEGRREMGMAARLSPFLLGEDVVVPMGGGSHHYEDLTERKIAMSNLLGRSCIHLLSFQRLPFVH